MARIAKKEKSDGLYKAVLKLETEAAEPGHDL